MKVLSSDYITYVEIGVEGLIRWRECNQTLILNETSNIIWTMLCAEASPDEIAGTMCGIFNIDEHTARADIDELMQIFRHEGLLVEDNSYPT
jgi:hypothetical protein